MMASEVPFDDSRPTLCSFSHPSERLWTKPANCKGAPWRGGLPLRLRHPPTVLPATGLDQKLPGCRGLLNIPECSECLQRLQRLQSPRMRTLWLF
ncbi:hypothetical protein LEMLEM_LOCUS9809 [Lemmus lemmus]